MGYPRVLVTGASGQLGGYTVAELARQGYELALWTGRRSESIDGITPRQVDLADRKQIDRGIEADQPDVLVHAGAVTSVAAASANPDHARRVNVEGTTRLADHMHQRGGRMVYISTDMVFDGHLAPYDESSEAKPVSVYGRSKLEGEAPVLAAERGVVMRPALLFGPVRSGEPKFFDALVAALREGKGFSLFHDEYRTPLGCMQAAEAIAALVATDVTGLLHVAGPQRMSRLAMGRSAARVLGVSDGLLESVSRTAHVGDEPRPEDLGLDCGRWRSLFPTLTWREFEDELWRMLR